jgi:hypothetical protein
MSRYGSLDETLRWCNLEFALRQETTMKSLKILLAVSLIAATIAPGVAVAKKKSGHNNSALPRTLTAEQRNKMLEECKKRWPIGPNSYILEYGTHYGQKTWWCVPTY